ncbi:MAG: polysaccharide biosynthesis C-terminal domain-containing protein [Bacteroidetes bacterium]|nr:polysaccharide biosynthesis C-terminal domain-containing protein [Bacteroidota bacterium]
MSIKKLAGQTLWYGLPTILSKFLSYFLNLILIWLYEPVNISSITQLYVLIPFLNILFTYGLETGFFRFIKDHPFEKLYGTLLTSITFSTLVLSAILWFFVPDLTIFFKAQDHPGFFYWMLTILIFDTLSALPFARLRYEERPRRFALIKMANVTIHLLLFVFFIAICPKLYAAFPNASWMAFFNPGYTISYYVVANIIASFITLLLLYKQLFSSKLIFDAKLLKEVLTYSMPLLIVGFGGMIGELFSRLAYTMVATGTDEQVRHELGVFSGVYRIVMMVNIFIYAYRMAAEPFFFKKSADVDAKLMYARLMKIFVMVCCCIFLFIVLFLDAWEYIITLKSKSYAEAMSIIPILSLAAIFLGVYYNQSIWYKLSDKNKIGAFITVVGAIITIVLNLLLIPYFKYNGAAWATLISYVVMMIMSYAFGQKYYPVKYDIKRIAIYLGLVLLLFAIHQMLGYFIHAFWWRIGAGVLLFVSFILCILKMDREEFASLPWIGKYLR